MSFWRWLPIVLFASGAITASACGGNQSGGAEPTYQLGGAGGDDGTGVGGKTAGSEDPENGSSSSGPPNNGPASSSMSAGTGGRPGGSGGGAGSGGNGGTGAGDGTGGGGTTTDDLDQCAGLGEPREFFMSPDDSSSMGSPALARELLKAGVAPPAELVRSYEFLNYYRVRYAPPKDGLLGLHAHFAPGDGDRYRLQVGVQAAAVKRPPLSLTFVVDVSGSLVGPGIARERAALRAIAKNLQKGDFVNFVVWSTENAVILNGHEVTGPNDPKLAEVVEDLAPGGGSDLHTGLVRGYELAKNTDTPQRLSRVVLLSDGGANLGVLDEQRIADSAMNGDDLGIYLVGIGVGPALGYSDKLMNLVTDAGRGSYVYLDSEAEAEAVLGKRFDEVMDIAARAVRISVTLPGYFEIEQFYGEEYSTDETLIERQHLAPSDSMILNQELVLNCTNCFPCPTSAVEVQVEWASPALHPADTSSRAKLETTLGAISNEAWQLLKAEAIVLYARALQTRSKDDFDRAKAALAKAQDSEALKAQDEHKEELSEIEELLAAFEKTQGFSGSPTAPGQ